MKRKGWLKALAVVSILPVFGTLVGCGDVNSDEKVPEQNIIEEKYSTTVEIINKSNPNEINNVCIVNFENGTEQGNIGDEVRFQLVLNTNYELININVNNITLDKTARSFTSFDKNMTLKVTIKLKDDKKPIEPIINKGTVTIDNSIKNGKVSIKDLKSEYDVGTELALIVTPNKGYLIDKVMHNNKVITAVDGIYKFTVVKGKNLITANFIEDTRATIEIDPNIKNGEVSIQDPKEQYSKGDEIVLKVTPSLNYIVDTITLNGEVLEPTNDIYKFNVVVGENLISATFIEKEKVSINLISPITNGKFTIDNEKEFYYVGTEVSFKVTPNPGFVIDHVKFNNEEVIASNGIYKITLVSENNDLDITFKTESSIADGYTITPIPELLNIARGLQHNVPSSTLYYAYGVVDKFDGERKYDIKNGNDSIFIYSTTNINNYKSTFMNGDEVVVYGSLKNYNGTLEMFDVQILEYKSSKPVGPEPQPEDPILGETSIDGRFTNASKYKVERIYDPKYIGEERDYSQYKGNLNNNAFYDNNYTEATTYKDAISRSNAWLISGDKNTPDHLANYRSEQGFETPKDKDGNPYFNARLRYIYDDSNYTNIIGYIINDLDNDDTNDTIIWKGGAYTSMDEVSAYLFAFHTVPANWIADKNSGKNDAVDNWGEYGRVNNGRFEGDPTTYPFQPLLTKRDELAYRECDFGHDGQFRFFNKDGVPDQPQSPYNNGNRISRGTCRFCYSSEKKSVKEPWWKLDDERHVFYTWSHYNDFEEYLNYKGGYGIKFGNLVVGNDYNTRNPQNPVSQPTPYTLAIFNK